MTQVEPNSSCFVVSPIFMGMIDIRQGGYRYSWWKEVVPAYYEASRDIKRFADRVKLIDGQFVFDISQKGDVRLVATFLTAVVKASKQHGRWTDILERFPHCCSGGALRAEAKVQVKRSWTALREYNERQSQLHAHAA